MQRKTKNKKKKRNVCDHKTIQDIITLPGFVIFMDSSVGKKISICKDSRRTMKLILIKSHQHEKSRSHPSPSPSFCECLSIFVFQQKRTDWLFGSQLIFNDCKINQSHDLRGTSQRSERKCDMCRRYTFVPNKSAAWNNKEILQLRRIGLKSSIL